MQVNVKIDTAGLLKWATDLSASKLKLTLKNSLNRAARAARTQAIKDIAADVGVSTARVRPGVSALRTASPSNLVASWTASKVRIGILATAGAVIARSGLTASTFRATGGGSSTLSAPKAFVVKSNKGRVVMVRRGKGRSAIKGVFAEMPSTAIAQPNSAPRREWQHHAEINIKRELEVGLQAVLNRASPPSDSGSNTD